MNMSLVNGLALARKSARMTQADVARAVGLSRMTVQRIEALEIDPRLSTVLELSRALGMEAMLVPSDLRAEVEAFLRSNGRFLAQPSGAGAPPSIVQELLKDGP